MNSKDFHSHETRKRKGFFIFNEMFMQLSLAIEDVMGRASNKFDLLTMTKSSLLKGIYRGSFSFN